MFPEGGFEPQTVRRFGDGTKRGWNRRADGWSSAADVLFGCHVARQTGTHPHPSFCEACFWWGAHGGRRWLQRSRRCPQ
ncbi:hypothetical protein GN956_G4100 [Arapaima gigas]